MRPWIVGIVLHKELLETLRDRRTIARVLLLPVLVYPLLAIAMSKLQSSHEEAQEARPSVLAVWGAMPPDVRELLLEKKKFELAEWRGADDDVRRIVADAPEGIGREAPPAVPSDKPRPPRAPEDLVTAAPDDPLLPRARDALASGAVEAVLVVTSRAARRYAEGGTLEVVTYVDSVRDPSAFAGARLESAFVRVRNALVDARLRERVLPPDLARPAVGAMRDTAPPDRKTGQLLGLMLPVMLMAMSLLGVFLPAVDLTAGEKERGTLQTLLCAPITAFEMMAGKFLTVWCVSLFMGGANVLSFALTVRRILPQNLPVPWWTYLATFGLLVPVTGFFSALFLGVAAFAKDFKDGQNILMPVYLPCTLLGMAPTLPGVEIDRVTALVPVVNVALLIKAVFMQRATADVVFLTVAVTTLYAVLAIAVAARVFGREEVMLGGTDSIQSLFAGARRQATPSLGLSLTAFAVVLVASFYGSAVLEKASTVTRIVVIQTGFFLFPVLAITALGRLSLSATLGLVRPPMRGVAAAVLLGASGWTLALAATALFPPPQDFVEAMAKELTLGGQPLPIALLVLALLPAVCEESVFRGFLFSGLRRLGPAAAIVGSAFLFAIAHGSIYRLLPTLTLGVILGFVRERTGSLLPGIVLHAMNNALLVSVARTRPAWVETSTMPATLWIGGAVIAFTGLALARSCRPQGLAREVDAIVPSP